MKRDDLMGDANEPKVDARDSAEIELWGRNGKGAELLFGPAPTHGLKDAWRAFLGQRIQEKPAKGPLAISHRTKGVPRRYDHIYIPTTWSVTRMEYALELATDAGSDHALVVATARLG